MSKFLTRKVLIEKSERLLIKALGRPFGAYEIIVEENEDNYYIISDNQPKVGKYAALLKEDCIIIKRHV